MRGNIFDIKRYAIHDGPGIRTTVFLKGCRLHCRWCHNPESQAVGTVSMKQVRKLGDREFEEIRKVGYGISVDELVEEIAKDAVFFEESGGGVTFSGGEPLLQKNIVFSLIESIYELSKIHGFYLATSFTTNGTLIDKDFVAKLSPYEPSFQITLDGWQNIHDKVRKYKVNGNGTYSQILSAIKLIQQDSPKSEILVRINVSNRTLDSLTNIANELAEIKQNNNLKIMVSKVWQVNAEKLDEKKILDFVLQCQTNKIQCSYLATSKYTYGCYADNYNQVVINYDGNIYKCTARTFSSENSYGLITSEGQLEWNEMKLQDRLNLELPSRCQICNFLPACPKPCSQKLLEKGENLPCILNKKYGKENYIIEDFYNFLIERNNEK